MPTFRIYEVTAVFDDGSFATVPINCSNSIEAIKAVLSSNPVIEKMGANNSPNRRDVVAVECKKQEFKA